MVEGMEVGEGLGIEDGAGVGTGVVGSADGLGDGIKVGWADNGVGSNVVGKSLGLGVGIVDGNALGEGVGMVEGAGVVGEGVLMGVGSGVGEGVGTQVVHDRDNVNSSPPVTKPPSSNTLHISSPIGGVEPHLPVVSSTTAYKSLTAMVQ